MHCSTSEMEHGGLEQALFLELYPDNKITHHLVQVVDVNFIADLSAQLIVIILSHHLPIIKHLDNTCSPPKYQQFQTVSMQIILSSENILNI